MFSVIYSFDIIPGKEDLFLTAWRELTILIYHHEGSLGSRLHKENERRYLAYAQWPNKETWKHAGTNLPKQAESVRAQMRQACTEIKTLYEMEVIDDLLIGQQYNK